MALVCGRCGRSNASERTFCLSCGADLPWAVGRMAHGTEPVSAVPLGASLAMPWEIEHANWFSTSPGLNPSNQGYVATWIPDDNTSVVQARNGDFAARPDSGSS